MAAVLDRFNELGNRAGRPHLGLFNFYGQEMHWLEDDIRSFVDRAVASGVAAIERTALGLLYRLLSLAFERREPNAFGQVLQVHEFAYFRAKGPMEQQAWERFRGGLLLQLENFADFTIGRGIAKDPDTRFFAERLIVTLSNISRLAIDARSEDDLQACGATLRKALSTTLRLGDDDLEPVKSLRAFRSAALLGLVAYLLLLRGMDRIEPAKAETLLTVLDGTGLRGSWAGYLIASRDVSADRFGWMQWVMSLRDERVGFVTFDHYVNLAFARELLLGHVSEPLEPTAQSSGDLRYTLERLTQAVSELLSDERWNWLDTSELQSREARVLADLNEAIEQDVRGDEDHLISLSLESERIQKFVDAVQKEWTSRGGLRRLFTERQSETSADPDSVDAPTDGADEFGLSQLVPKEYFATTRVHAEPDDLGREFGIALVRGEDLQLLATISSVLPHRTVQSDQLADSVRAAATSLRKAGRSPTILLLNSWRLTELLGLGVVRVDSDDPADFDGTPTMLRYTEGDAMCVVADFSVAAVVNWWPEVAQRAGDQVVGGGRLAVGVEELTEQKAAEMAEGRPDILRRDDDEEYPTELAIRRLRQRVVARAFERFSVETGPADAGEVIHVDGLTD